MQVKNFGALLLLSMSTSACGLGPPPAGLLPQPTQMRRSIAAPPAKIVSSAVPLLAQLGMTVANSDAANGSVTSSPLTVRGLWQTKMVRERLYCGKQWDSGVETSISQPVHVVIGFVAAPTATGSDVLLIVNATATWEKPSGIAGSAESYPCQPTTNFATFLLDTLAARAMR